MITSAAHIAVQWIGLDDIRWDSQAIDLAQVAYYEHMFAGNDSHLAPPMLNPDLTIRDGRHRLCAMAKTGRTQARVLIITEPKGA